MDNFLRQTAVGHHALGEEGQAAVPVPPRLAGYRTGRLLGVGGNSAVWQVEEQRTGEVRALKVLAASRGRRDQAQLEREVTILAGLRHPHVLELRHAHLTEDGPALLMEFAGGGSLHNLVVSRGRLSVGECVTVLVPIAQALAFLHSRSVLHNDVSPGNVLFTSEGKPVLADLGVGRLLGEGEEPTAYTPGFSAPVARTGAGLDWSADVYSLAAVGWYALTGRTPGTARQRPPLTVLVPSVPQELLEILEAGLREDPAQRPSAAEFAQAVLRSAAPEPLDLVAAVHPTVLPDLITRRAVRDGPEAGQQKFPATLTRLLPGGDSLLQWWRARPHKPARLQKGGAGRSRPDRGPRIHRRATGSRGSRRAEKRGARNFSRSGVLLRFAAVLLVGAGGLLALPDLLGHSDAVSEAGAHPLPPLNRSLPGKDGGSASSGTATVSQEMRGRLADTDPLVALPALAAVRARALATGEPDLLSHVNVSGSAAMAADREIIDGLSTRDQVFRGLTVRLESLKLRKPETVPAGDAAVSARAVISDYEVMDRSGEILRRVPQPEPQELLFVLTRNDGLWRISAVYRAEAV